MTGVEELEIDEGEGEKLATSAAAVLAHYPNTVISPKTVDIMTLMMALGSVYGPRAIAFRNRRAEERSNRQRPAQVMVQPAPTPAAPAGVKKVDPASGAVGHAPDGYVPGFSGFVEQTGRR